MAKTNRLLPTVFTPAQWRSDKELQAELRKHLESSVMRMAFATVQQQALPRIGSVINPIPGVDADAMDKAMAYGYTRSAGMVEALRALVSLTKESTKHEEKPHWGALEEESEK